MEAKSLGGGEVRRLHIIYFLSYMGRAEHPHLIRVHHLTRTGVYLRDVKRWLGELRGKDMPEAYAWSYKRRYKNGYVWQDLVDEDLITPLSDNEYVLKGSEIIFSSSDEKTDIARHSYSRVEKESTKSTANMNNPKKQVDQEEKCERQDSKNDPPSRIFSEINEEESSSFGSDRSSLTDEFESVKFESEKLTLDEKRETTNHTVAGNLRSKKAKEEPICSNSPLPSKSRKSFSGGAFRNLITCGGVDTNDAALVAVNRHRRGQDDTAGSDHNGRCEVVKGDRLARSSRVFGSFWDRPEEELGKARNSSRRSFDEGKGSKKQQQNSEFTKQTPIPTEYRPVKEPNCSQCGKAFKPEKMHSHMKSCRGKRNSAKTSICCASVETSSISNSQHGSKNSIYKQSALGYLLTN